MRTIRRTFSNLPGSILLLGRAGENNVTKLELDVSKEQSEFKDASFELVLKTPASQDPYPVVVEVTNNKLTYHFSGSDLAESGYGQLEALVVGSEGELLKSATAKIKINPSIIPNTYPGPLQKVIDDIKDSIGDIAAKAGIKVVNELPSNPNTDTIVYYRSNGLYWFNGTEWVQITDDELLSNNDTLKKLSEYNGILYFDGDEIGGINKVNTVNDLDPDAENGSVAVVLSGGITTSPVSFPHVGDDITISDGYLTIGAPSYDANDVFTAFVDKVAHTGYVEADPDAEYDSSEGKDYYSYDSSTGTYTDVTETLNDGDSVAGLFTRDVRQLGLVGEISYGDTDVYASIIPIGDNAVSDLEDAGFDLEEAMVLPGLTVTYPFGIILMCEDWYEDNILMLAYVFEDIDAGEFQLTTGWNVGRMGDGDELEGFEHVDDISTVISRLGDVGDQITVNLRGVDYPHIFDGLLQQNSSVGSKGLYIKLDDEWQSMDIDTLRAAITLLEADSHTHDNGDALDAITPQKMQGWDAAAQDRHTHDNKTTLDRFNGTTDDAYYNGKKIPLIAPDDVTLLGFETYNDIVIRDEVINDGGIQHVPVYTGGYEEICRLWVDDGGGYYNCSNYIALQEVRQELDSTTLGMPVRVVYIVLDGVRYAYYGAEWIRDGVDNIPAGWRGGILTSLNGFTPNRFSANGVDYSSVDNLPADARSALRSLSQCINVSAAAMGTIKVPDDAVQRFAGDIEPNHKYWFDVPDGSEITFSLPDAPWSEEDAQFVLYLNCGNYVDLIFPQTVQFAGGEAPSSEAGRHKLIGCWLRESAVWSIGGVDYEAVT